MAGADRVKGKLEDNVRLRRLQKSRDGGLQQPQEGARSLL